MNTTSRLCLSTASLELGEEDAALEIGIRPRLETEEGVRAKFCHFPSVVQTSPVLYGGADTTRSNADVEHVMTSAP